MMLSDTRPVSGNTPKFASRVEGIDHATSRNNHNNNNNSSPAQTKQTVKSLITAALEDDNHHHQNNDNHHDPFAAHRTADNNPFVEAAHDDTSNLSLPSGGGDKRDRRLSKEWDAAKVPPSRFQKREGSIYATQASRDGRVDKNAHVAFDEKLKEKGWA